MSARRRNFRRAFPSCTTFNVGVLRSSRNNASWERRSHSMTGTGIPLAANCIVRIRSVNGSGPVVFDGNSHVRGLRQPFDNGRELLYRGDVLVGRRISEAAHPSLSPSPASGRSTSTGVNR